MARSISLIMIVKNEAHHLHECLESVRGLVDEICICDTGSTDDTLAVAQEFGAKTSVFIWCDDFSAARNESLRLATKDWVFCIDADERLNPQDIPTLRQMTEGPQDHCYWLPIRNYTDTTSVADFVACEVNDPYCRGFAGWYPAHRVRLFPNGTGAKYEGKVHELIGPCLERMGYKIQGSDIPVHHYPLVKREAERVQDKQEMYLRLGHEKIRQNPDDPKGYMELGNQYAEVKDYENAAAAYREALKRNPSDAGVLMNMGGVLHALGRDTEAKQALQLSLQLDPALSESWRNLGVIYADEKEWKAALECFERAMECDPQWVEGHRYRSVALERLDRMDEAVAASKTALEAMPHSGECLKLFIHQMLRLERRPQAREVITGIINRGVADPNLHNALGELFFYDKDVAESIRHFTAAAELGLPAAYNNLGVVHFHVGALDDAREAFEACLASDPGHKGAQRNLQKVMDRQDG